MERITALTNSKIKQIVRLQRQSRCRRETGLFCVESERELARALEAGLAVRRWFVCRERLGGSAVFDRAERAAGEVFEVTEAVLGKMTYREHPQGFVAVLAGRAEPSTRLKSIPMRGFSVVCSGLEKPGNVGAILRSADAAGADAVMIDTADYDLYNPHCIRASTGAVFAVPVVCAERYRLIEALRSGGVRIVAATPEADLPYTRADLAGPIAFVLGAEHAGLDADWKQQADVRVALPVGGTVDSLNVSVAAAVLMYEARRQNTPSP